MLLAAAGAARFVPADLRRARDLSLEVQSASGAMLNAGLARDGIWRLRTGVRDVDPAYLRLLLQREDKRFYAHGGVDPFAMLRAAGQLAVNGRVISGGSTITMQVARLLHPHAHDFAGKLRDMAVAVQLESQLSKTEILALYLTLAPFGGNIEGVRAASWHYFGHAPDRLAPEEAALLVALPQSPAARRPDRHPATAAAAVRRVLASGGQGGFAPLHPPPGAGAPGPAFCRLTTDSSQATDQGPGAVTRQRASHDGSSGMQGQSPCPPEASPPIVSLHRFPRMAAPVADRLRAAGYSGPVRTTLDDALQREAERFARGESGWNGGGTEVAALVVRNRDRAVLAYAGGSGAIDLARAVRSPGSALKPFIYGVAMDDGLIGPDTLIEDTRLRIADYAPENFDRAFHGTVTAATALQQSYNLPAVTVLDWVGPARMAAVLRATGMRLVLPGDRAPTLPLALGGVGTTLWDMLGLYAGLGDGGMVRPLRLRVDEPIGAGTPLMSGAAAGTVLGILRAAPRPDGVAEAPGRAVAYKTGTSFGFRDAWAFGVTDAVTIGVWMGRADGTPRPGAFARETAAPLMFRLFDLLPASAGVSASGPEREFSAVATRRLPARSAGRYLVAPPPRIVYPPPDVLMSVAPGAPLILEAAGGAPPYAWSVNGVPVAAAAPARTASWQPDGPGFVHVTLTDRRGRSAQQDLRLQ